MQVLFSENIFQTQAALSAHQAQEHFKRLGEIKNEFVDETILEKYITE
jgi:hypothetical protein